MHRFFQPDQSAFDQPLIKLPDEEAHHACKVLRLRDKTYVAVYNGRGEIAEGELRIIGKGSVLVQVHKRIRRSRPAVEVWLFQGLTKTQSFEWVIEKATELGVWAIVPVVTQRTIPQIESNRTSNKLQRWKAIAIAALKQSGCSWLPQIHPPANLREALQLWQNSICRINQTYSFVAMIHQSAKPLGKWLGLSPNKMCATSVAVAYWVGPEGDFSASEANELLQADCKPVCLGPNILRAETAALAGIILIQYEFQWRHLTMDPSHLRDCH